MRDSVSSNRPVGAVFTPLKWAKWLVQEFGIARKWLDGATVCDPTAGEGVFVFALLDAAETLGVDIKDELLKRVFLIERDERFIRRFIIRFKTKYSGDFPASNIFATDLVLNPPPVKADVLLGNPPWVNFTDLDADYKQALKPHFLDLGLVHDRQALLLGSSRIDLAALIVAKAIHSVLTERGEAVLFVPMSLFLNDAAHAGFRNMVVKNITFAVRSIHDFGNENVFDSASTRYGVARFERDTATHYPVPYWIRENGHWLARYAAPMHGNTSPLSILESQDEWSSLQRMRPIRIQKDQIPRQGVNTCGANEVFIFDQFPAFLPEEYVFPLLAKENFTHPDAEPKRFIVLPYDVKTGKPLDEVSLRRQSGLWQYLNEHRQRLTARKGTIIGTWINRKIWWACLGVGTYSFAPYKLVWEALGKKRFNPVVVKTYGGKPWQANQALHCFIPLRSETEAQRLSDEFHNPKVEHYLLSLKMAGTCNWAQPGRIKRLLHVHDEQAHLELTLA